eukprot:gene8163-biopygen6306
MHPENRRALPRVRAAHAASPVATPAIPIGLMGAKEEAALEGCSAETKAPRAPAAGGPAATPPAQASDAGRRRGARTASRSRDKPALDPRAMAAVVSSPSNPPPSRRSTASPGQPSPASRASRSPAQMPGTDRPSCSSPSRRSHHAANSLTRTAPHGAKKHDAPWTAPHGAKTHDAPAVVKPQPAFTCDTGAASRDAAGPSRAPSMGLPACNGKLKAARGKHHRRTSPLNSLRQLHLGARRLAPPFCALTARPTASGSGSDSAGGGAADGRLQAGKRLRDASLVAARGQLKSLPIQHTLLWDSHQRFIFLMLPAWG